MRSVTILAIWALLANFAHAQTLDQSTIKEVVNQADILESKSLEATPAKQGELYNAPDLLRTGRKSRVQLLADDGTITRVGSNTVFSYEPGKRQLNLKSGNVLFYSPPGNGGGKVVTAAASAAVLGTTIIVSATEDGGFKTLCLEGEAQMQLPNGGTQTIQAGQMGYIQPGGVAGPVVNISLSTLMQGSSLINGFQNELPSIDKIEKESAKQEEQQTEAAPATPAQTADIQVVAPSIREAVNIDREEYIHNPY